MTEHGVYVFFDANTLARSRFSFTYSLTSSYTDVGFGCMLRSLQMLLAHTLRVRIVEADNGKWMELFQEDTLAEATIDTLLQSSRYIEMVSNFAEGAGGMCCLSQLVNVGSRKFGASSWSWYSPRIACLIAAEIMNNHNYPGNLMVHVANNREVYELELETLFEEGTKSSGKEGDHSVLLLVPCRLGKDSIEEQLQAEIIKHVRDPCCVGLIGGPSSRGLYCFATTESDTLLCLDPHTTVRVEVGEGSSPESDEFLKATHTHTNMQEIRLDELNPELAFGFLFKDKDALSRWFASATEEAEKESSKCSKAITLLHGPALPTLGIPEEDASSEDGEEDDDWKLI